LPLHNTISATLSAKLTYTKLHQIDNYQPGATFVFKAVIVYIGFTGIDSAYEAPDAPELSLDTCNASVDECVQEAVAVLEKAVSFTIQKSLISTHKFFSDDNLLWPYAAIGRFTSEL